MKRELLSVLIRAALIVPADVEAQRGRKHVSERGPRVIHTAPAAASGRLARCRAPVHARSFECRPANRVVYSSPAGYVGPAQLRRILGPQTVNRVRRAGHRLGLRSAPRGHWVESWRHGLVLVVTMNRVDIAEFVDYDRDGFIDDAFFFRHDGGRRWVSRP